MATYSAKQVSFYISVASTLLMLSACANKNSSDQAASAPSNLPSATPTPVPPNVEDPPLPTASPSATATPKPDDKSTLYINFDSVTRTSQHPPFPVSTDVGSGADLSSPPILPPTPEPEFIAGLGNVKKEGEETFYYQRDNIRMRLQGAGSQKCVEIAELARKEERALHVKGHGTVSRILPMQDSVGFARSVLLVDLTEVLGCELGNANPLPQLRAYETKFKRIRSVSVGRPGIVGLAEINPLDTKPISFFGPTSAVITDPDAQVCLRMAKQAREAGLGFDIRGRGELSLPSANNALAVIVYSQVESCSAVRNQPTDKEPML